MAYVLAFNMDAAPNAADRIATALGADDPLTGLQQLRERLSATRRLADYGFTADNLTLLLEAALTGDDPFELRRQL